MQETQVRSLSWEDPLEKGMTTHSSILAKRILWTEEPGGLQSMESKELDTIKQISLPWGHGLTFPASISLSTSNRGEPAVCGHFAQGMLMVLNPCPTLQQLQTLATGRMTGLCQGHGYLGNIWEAAQGSPQQTAVTAYLTEGRRWIFKGLVESWDHCPFLWHLLPNSSTDCKPPVWWDLCKLGEITAKKPWEPSPWTSRSQESQRRTRWWQLFGAGERSGETVSDRRKETPKLLRQDPAWTRLGLMFTPPAKLACPQGWAGWATALGMIRRLVTAPRWAMVMHPIYGLLGFGRAGRDSSPPCVQNRHIKHHICSWKVRGCNHAARRGFQPGRKCSWFQSILTTPRDPAEVGESWRKSQARGFHRSRGCPLHWCCCSSVAQLCSTLCDSRDCSNPGFPVLQHLLEFTQIHVHWVGDAIQPSHPLSPCSLPPLNPSQHQGFFQQVSSSHQVAKELELQHQSFQWIFRVDFL